MSILDNLNNLGKKAQEYAGVAVDKARDLAEVAAIEKSIFSQPWSENGFAASLQSKDTLYLTETGCESLSAAIPRKLEDIEDAMAH